MDAGFALVVRDDDINNIPAWMPVLIFAAREDG